jgi:hypothetical protein
MKTHFDKDTSIITITIAIAFLLLLSIFHGKAQGLSYNKVIITKKVQSSYERYTQTLKEKYCIPTQDTLKKKPLQSGSGNMKRIKKGVSYMLISKCNVKNEKDIQRESCYLPCSKNQSFYHYEKYI